MSAEPRPPWKIRRSLNPGQDPHWRTAEGREWLRDVFLPYYDALSATEQSAYCERWNAPQAWITLFLHPELDEIARQADEKEFGEAAPALNFRKILLGE